MNSATAVRWVPSCLVWASALVACASVRGQSLDYTVANGFQAEPLTSLVGDTTNAAVAYAPNGTLYVVQGANYVSGGPYSSTTIDVINPNGTLGTPLNVSSASLTPSGGSFASVSGATWDPVTGTLLVVDQDNSGAIYSVPVTGPSSGGQIQVNATTVFSGDPFISQVAVRASTGDIFYSDSPGGVYYGTNAPAGIYEVDRSTSASTLVASAATDFISGIGFDSSGHIIYQAGDFASNGTPTANVYQAQISGSGSGTMVSSPPTTLASNTATYALAVTSDGNVFIAGSTPPGSVTPYTYGLFEVNQALNTAGSFFTYSTNSSGDFGTSVAYYPGSGPFESNAGVNGGQMALVLSDSSGSAGGPGNYVFLITPVPEPSTWALLAIGRGVSLAARRWRRAGAGR